MGEIVLKKEILDKIKKQPKLFGDVMEAIDATPSYGIQLLKNNDPKFTQANVLRILREHLGDLKDSDLLEELPASEKETAQ